MVTAVEARAQSQVAQDDAVRVRRESRRVVAETATQIVDPTAFVEQRKERERAFKQLRVYNLRLRALQLTLRIVDHNLLLLEIARRLEEMTG